MTESRQSDSDRESLERTIAHMQTMERVDLAPAQRCIDVTACCGPEARHVMVNAYHDGTMFLSPDEAEQLAAVLIRKATETRGG